MPVRVLFICVENSCRSQMAEALVRMQAREEVEAYSAGSRPSSQVNPKAITSLAELGYDLSTHRSKGLSEVEGLEFDAVVSMGCGDACPTVPARRRIEWNIPDPKHLPDDQFREVREHINQHVQQLLRELKQAR
jgi:arsenate reductase